MSLRKGRTKALVESSVDSALLAVEIYNKPRTPFRVESYITNMIMAWTRLLHAHFYHTIGDTYFHKERNGRYKIIDGEKKAWELKTCVQKYDLLSDPIKANLEFFIKLRNKIEHRTIDKDQIDIIIFGECQSMLYNYENELIKLFGEEYALNESLAFALQFSRVRTTKQNEANRKILSAEYKEIKYFIEKYRENLKEDIYSSQEYSIKLIQIPRISNTDRNDLAVEFVNWSTLSDDDKEKYVKLTTIIKDKVVKKEVINPGKLKFGKIIKEVNNSSPSYKFNNADHKHILAIFSIRPYKQFDDNPDPFHTNTKYCHYDEAHEDYLYHERWVRFLVAILTSGRLTKEMWKTAYDNKEKIDIQSYEIE